MKKLLALIAIAFTVQTFAWPVQTGVWFSYTNASSQVFNNFNRPIVCRGYLVAQTMYGNRLQTWLNNSVIFPGQYQGMFVYSNMNDPITGAWSNAECFWY
jgi:hypothetical protein